MEGIDPDGVTWSRVCAATYRVEQTLRYEYASPISDLRHRLVISPRALHGDQRRLTHRLWTSAGVPCTPRLDRFGNTVAEIALARVERSITFSLESTVVREAAAPPHALDPDADRLDWRGVRRLVRADAALTEIARELAAAYPDERERAAAIVRFVHTAITYTKGETDVFTTASVAFSMRRGVCQDYAHVAIALARAAGLRARYVSGHLLGEGATHAWVELLVCDDDGRTRVLSYDPTYGCPTTFRYITVAIGRDYDDVAPTSGAFTGTSPGTLRGTQRVILTSVA